MPLEFSVAAYRFGHSMVRGALRLQPQLRPPAADVLPIGAVRASCSTSPARAGSAARPTMLPFNWVIEWDRFVEKDAALPDHFARKIDTQLAAAAGHDDQRESRAQIRDRSSSRSSSTWPCATCCAATSCPCRPARRSPKLLGVAR